MIKRFLLKEYLSFEKATLEFRDNFIVFTGASGAGKSVFFSALLGVFGLVDTKPKVAEVLLDKKISLDEFSSDDEIIIKQLTKDRVRYFLNEQIISKKKLKELNLIKYLHIKDNDLDSFVLLEFLDYLISLKDKNFSDKIQIYKDLHNDYEKNKKELKDLVEKEKNIDDIKEFLEFEINKIKSINPKVGEYEELLNIKKQLKEKEKLQQKLSKATEIFNYRFIVNDILDSLEVDNSFFNNSLDELEIIFERIFDNFELLDEINIEETLDRLEKLSSLKRKYGSIERAIEVLDEKEKEYQKYDNIIFQKSKLEKNIKQLKDKLSTLAIEISQIRYNNLDIFQKELSKYTKKLYIDDIKLKLEKTNLLKTGIDKIVFDNKDIDKLSSGEINRLRLAFLALNSKYNLKSGILFLDEIDANLSGKESESIAIVLEELSKNYQIFAISHHLQLASKAKQHFLIEKKNNKSTIKELSKDERIKEIARLISGENIDKKALDYAKSLIC